LSVSPQKSWEKKLGVFDDEDESSR
jgi:hypothetical protein